VCAIVTPSDEVDEEPTTTALLKGLEWRAPLTSSPSSSLNPPAPGPPLLVALATEDSRSPRWWPRTTEDGEEVPDWLKSLTKSSAIGGKRK